MVAVAQSVARLPAIHDAFDDETPRATIQPIAEVIREASDVTYVVVTDDDGIRCRTPTRLASASWSRPIRPYRCRATSMWARRPALSACRGE